MLCISLRRAADALGVSAGSLSARLARAGTPGIYWHNALWFAPDVVGLDLAHFAVAEHGREVPERRGNEGPIFSHDPFVDTRAPEYQARRAAVAATALRPCAVACADVFADGLVTAEEILARKRYPSIIPARTALYLLLVDFGFNAAEVGRATVRNHSTVVHALTKNAGEATPALGYVRHYRAVLPLLRYRALLQMWEEPLLQPFLAPIALADLLDHALTHLADPPPAATCAAIAAYVDTLLVAAPRRGARRVPPAPAVLLAGLRALAAPAVRGAVVGVLRVARPGERGGWEYQIRLHLGRLGARAA